MHPRSMVNTSHRRRMSAISAAGIALVGAAAIACVGLAGGSGGSSGARQQVIVAAGDELLPSATAQDWVTYGDLLVRLRVTGASELPPTEEEVAAGEGFIPRGVVLDVEQVLWRRPSFDMATPRTLHWSVDGWRFHGESRTPIRLQGEPTLAPGHTYVAMITHLSVTDRVRQPGWIPLSVTSILPDQDNVLGKGDRLAGVKSDTSEGLTTMQRSVWRQPVSTLLTILRAERPDPSAAQWMAAPPDIRYRNNHT